MSRDSSPSDVVIVGAGLAGATAAFVLSKTGIDVTLLDPTLVQPPVFKAEKINAENAKILRSFGLMDILMPECRRIKRIACGQNGRVWTILETEEYGFFYQDIVNAIRRSMPESVRFRTARVVQIRTGADTQEVTLDDGSTVKGRLLALTAGATGKLHEKFGIQRRIWNACHSVSLAFNLKAANPFPGGAESVTYREDPTENKIDYLTLFPAKDLLRANLFTYWDVKDPKVQDMRNRGFQALLELMPKLPRVTGPLELCSTVEVKPIDLYRVEQPERPGVVMLGDVYQSVCPVTGSGVGKVLTDVQTLARLAPEWLRTPGMGVEKISRYYACEKKRATDEKSLQDGLYSRRLGLDRSLPWTARRWKKYFPRWVASLRAGKTVCLNSY